MMSMTIRELLPEDAEQLLKLQLALDDETAFMMLEPGERKAGEEETRRMIQSYADSPNSILLGAFDGSRLAGYVSARGGSANRIRHSAYIVIGILKEYQGKGAGSALLKRLETLALERGLVRLELTVMTHNERAVALYTRSGFQIEGTKVKSLNVGGSWVDEFYMAKVIGERNG